MGRQRFSLVCQRDNGSYAGPFHSLVFPAQALVFPAQALVFPAQALVFPAQAGIHMVLPREGCHRPRSCRFPLSRERRDPFNPIRPWDRMPVLDALLEIAADNRGATTLYTSELSRVEVHMVLPREGCHRPRSCRFNPFLGKDETHLTQFGK